VLAKVANVGVPVLMKKIVDSLDPRIAILTVPLALLVAYGLLRLSTTVFTELREFLFAKVTQRAVRRIGLTVFRHLHALSLRFHLARQTGGLTRDVERGQRGISTLISFTLFSILPTLVEIGLVAAIMVVRYDWTFIAITLTALVLYVAATITITDNSGSSPHVINVTGIGSDLSLQNMLFFNKGVRLGKKAWLGVPVQNVGTTPITISAVSEVGPNYLISSTNCITTLAPGATCAIQVQFAPTVTGTAWAQVNISDTDPGSPHQIRLVGTGVALSALPVLAAPVDESKELVDDGDDD